MGGTVLIAAVKYVCVLGKGGGGSVGVGVIVWVGGCDCVGVGVIAWVRNGVCGWYSLNCCCKVCMCVGGVGGVCVGVTVWVWV